MSRTSAKIIADNESIEGVRITTFEVTYPRFIMAEINTHRTIAKSSASSRAIPVKRRIEDVMKYPFVPAVFGKNKRGMQAGEAISENDHRKAFEIWNTLVSVSLQAAAAFEKIGVHKQLANRVLEPYAYATTVLTATEWDNFFNLRAHPDVQPEFQELAYLMRKMYDANVPYSFQGAHVPYTTAEEAASLEINTLYRVSAARCARVSYLSLETGEPSTVEEDLALCDRLLKAGHMSPFDHVATADTRADNEWKHPGLHRHFYGWIPLRVSIEGANPSRRFAVPGSISSGT